MPYVFPCFGTAMAVHGVSRPAATSVPGRVRQQREVSYFTAAGAGWSAASSASGSSPAAPDAAARKSTPSIWLQPPGALVRGGSVGASPEPSSIMQLEAAEAYTAKANPRGSHVQQKSPVTREAGRRVVSRRYSLQSRSGRPTRPEDTPPRVAYAPDEGCTREGLGSNTGASRAPRVQRLDERQLLGFPAEGWAPAEATTSGGEAVEALQEQAYDVDFRGPGGSDIHTEDFRRHQGSPASAGNGGATARDGGRGRKSWQTGRAGAEAPSLRSRPPTEGVPGGRRVFRGERSFTEDAEDQHSNKYFAEEEAAGGRGAADGPCDDKEGINFTASSRRRRRRSSTGRSSLVHEKPQPPLLVKPCIWIAPQFPVERWTAGGAGAAEAVSPAQQAPEAVAGGRAAAVSLPTYLDSAVLTSFETCAKGLRSSQSPGKDTVVGVGASAGVAAVSGLRGSRNVGLIRKVSWRLRGHHKRRSALRFFAKRVFWLFCYFAVADVFMSVLSTASDVIFQHNPQPKLRDRFHDWVLGGTPPPGLAQTVTDCLTVSLLVVTLLRHLLFVQLPLNLLIICRYFFLMATTYWLRGIAIFLTTMPSSVPNCKVRPVYSASDFVRNVVLASTFQLPQCTDMIISGHTLTTCLCVATWLFYNNCNKDEAEMRRAPFHMLVRWLLRYRRSATAQQEPGSCSPPAGAETVGHRRQLQQRQQQPEQRVKKSSVLDSQAFSGSDERTEGACAASDGSLFGRENKRNQACTASLVRQYRSSTKTRRDEGSSSSCGEDLRDGRQGRSTSSDTIQVCGRLVADDVYPKDGLKFLNVADGEDELQSEEEAARAAGEETAGGKEGGQDMGAERRAPRAVTSRAVLRNEAVFGAAAAATETFVAAAAVAGGVFFTAAVPPDGSFPVAHLEGSTISVSETAASSLDGTACAANTACAVPFGACGGEVASPSAASAALCAAFAAAAVVEEDERKSSTHLQEMEDFSGAAVDHTATGAAEPQVMCTDNEDYVGLKTQMKATVGEQSASEIRCTAEDCLCLLTDITDGGKEAMRSKRLDFELPGPYHIFRRPAALGQERPDFSGHSAPVTGDENPGFTEFQTAGCQRREARGLGSAFASTLCSVRAAVAAVDDEKVRDDGSSLSQCTAGAGSCSSSEEDDGMRALLAPHQSRRHHGDKENISQFSCCAMPPGLSTFFAAAHDSVSRGHATEEEAAASSVVPVDEAAAADEEKTTGGCGGTSKSRCYGIRAQKGEELERMGQDGSGKRRAGSGRGELRSQVAAPGGSARGRFAQCCRRCLSGIRRGLLTLLGWACAWNLLGTWCILQAAANIIIIDASFCHYTVDIFFGVIFSFGCFTFYHMIVCLLWAARTQDDAGAADNGEGYYAVVRLPAARLYRRRGSCYRNPNSGDFFDTVHPCARAAGAGRELPRLFSPCRRRAARSAAGSRLRVTEAAGAAAAATGPGGVPQATVGIQKSYAERRLGVRGRKARDVGKGADLSERGNDESGLPERDPVTSVVGGSTAVALSVMNEVDVNACHTETASRMFRPPAGMGGATCTDCAAPVEDMPQFATGDTAGIAASSASVKGGAELPVTNALSEDKEKGLGSCSKEDRLQLLAYPDQRQRGECAELAAVQQQEIGGMSSGGDSILQPTVHQLRERPADAIFTSSEEARQPWPPLWDRVEGATGDAMEQLNFASSARVHASKRDGSGGAGGAAPDEVCDRRTRVAAGTTQREALRERQKTARSSEDIAAEGVTARGHRVLQLVERTISGESHADVAADIAISILRFPLVRCAALFIARLEGLELP